MKIRTLGKIKGRVKVSEEIYNIVENPPNILIRRPSCSTKDHFTSINSRCSHTGPIINGHRSTFIQDQNLTNSFLCVMIFYAHPSPSLCWHYDYFLGPHSLPIFINDPPLHVCSFSKVSHVMVALHPHCLTHLSC